MKKMVTLSLVMLFTATPLLAKELPGPLGYVKVLKSKKGKLGLGKAEVVQWKEWKKEDENVKKYPEVVVNIKGKKLVVRESKDHKKPLFTITDIGVYCVKFDKLTADRLICVKREGDKHWYGVAEKDKKGKLEIKKFIEIENKAFKKEPQITQDIVNMTQKDLFKTEVYNFSRRLKGKKPILMAKIDLDQILEDAKIPKKYRSKELETGLRQAEEDTRKDFKDKGYDEEDYDEGIKEILIVYAIKFYSRRLAETEKNPKKALEKYKKKIMKKLIKKGYNEEFMKKVFERELKKLS